MRPTVISTIISLLASMPLKAVDMELLFGIERSKNHLFTTWDLFTLTLSDHSKTARGSLTLPAGKLIVRPNLKTAKIAYYNRDSARTNNWLEIGEINLDNRNSKKHLLLKTKETEIKDFYWRDAENLIVQISHYIYSPSYFDELGIVRSTNKSYIISYNTNTNEIDSLLTVDYDFELISSNTKFIYILHKELSRFDPRSGEIIHLGKYHPHGYWPDPRLQYALIRPHRPTITHFVSLDENKTFQVPEYNDQFLAKLKSTEINDYGLRYYMDHISWSGSEAYYTFTPVPEPKVFVNLQENKYWIFEYDFITESSRIVYEITLAEYFEIKFSPLMISNDALLARKYVSGNFVYYFIDLKSGTESVVFRTDYLGKVKIFNCEYAGQ